ncbi:urease accessory protein UreF [Paenibacillus wulumuqiensis]|uniref:urease accessory protein UreF n=1 Tax=Paenibacillus wulumuqiensis TaxID=1567107 RepID=UPI000619E93A|nr:urease accessory UreF family protein [Paenibacillus wulumuqiensis]
MNSSQKLLAYVQLLDAKLPTASFTHAHHVEQRVQEGIISNVAQLEQHLVDHLQPHLFQWEAPAIHSVYMASSEQDAWTLALIDKMIIQQIIPAESRDEARKTGKRLLKLAHSLYPWMSFTVLERAVYEYQAILSLTTLHAWINYHLGTERDQAVNCYLYTLLSCCISRAARPLQLSIPQAGILTDRLSLQMEQQWQEQSNQRQNSPGASPVSSIIK